MNDVLDLLAKDAENIDISTISSDEDGYIVFPSSVELKEIKYLLKEIFDLPIQQYGEKPSEDEPTKPDKIKYYCICNDESACTECTNGIQANEVSSDSSISSDPGADVEIRVYSNCEISSSIFDQLHDVIIDAKYHLNIINVEKVDLSNTTKLKVDKLSFTSGTNVNIKPKSSDLSITLSTVAAGKDFNVEIPSSLTSPLKLVISNKENNVIAPTLNIIGSGEVNTYDYPFDKIKSPDTIKLIK